MTEDSLAFLSRKNIKTMSPDKSAQAFLTQLSESRQAFDIFRDEAKRKGFLSTKFSSKNHQHDYYEKYIKPRNFPGGSGDKKYKVIGRLN